MWLFKPKKVDHSHFVSGPLCSECGSRNVYLKVNYAGDQPEYIKIWRGRKYVNYHCRDCGVDFSQPEEKFSANVHDQVDAGIIDEEALKTAEEELKRATDEEGDRRCH